MKRGWKRVLERGPEGSKGLEGVEGLMVRGRGDIWIRRGGEGIPGGKHSVNRNREAGSVPRKRLGWGVMGGVRGEAGRA